tara:strand:- start:798 stop:1070 length:273 start_codon:yes stop_codon:yes gene_type:complete
MPLPTEARLGLSNQMEVLGIRDAKLLDLEFVDQGQPKHRLLLQVGTAPGERAFFSFPEKLGTNLEIWPLSDRLAADVAAHLDQQEKAHAS